MLLNVNNFSLSEGLTPKFVSKVGASFSIVKWVLKNIYKLELLANIKVRPTFHVSLLKRFVKDTLCPIRK